LRVNDGLIAALDVGKTHTRVGFIDPARCAEVWSARRTNHSAPSALGLQLDVVGIEQWLTEALRTAPGRDRVRWVVPVAHGAAVVLIAEDGRVLAAPDYEDPRFESVNADYEPERDAFTRSYSPPMPLGLNVGRQLYYLEQREPELFAQVAHILTYPQFWAWRFSGVLATEVTSLGCHSDLWLPQAHAFSELALRRRWTLLFPSMRSADEPLGRAAGPLSRAAQLSPDCVIACGIHDSNASYLRYLLERRSQAFAVISSGTWTVAMANQTPLNRLRVERDMSGNVDAFGSPVATARFMGGREYEAIARTKELPTLAGLREVLGRDAMALPAFAPGGPCAGTIGRVVNGEGLSDGGRAALASLYVALVCDLLLESLGVGDCEAIVDGPLASNPVFTPVLARLRPRDRVLPDTRAGDCGTVCYLAGLPVVGVSLEEPVRGVELDGLDRYRTRWRSLMGI
jgi:L-fuculokinase